MKESKHFFFTQEEERRIEQSIREAEGNTSGEIRVRIEHRDGGDAYKRAVHVFERLGMTKTALRNGILFYLSTDNHHFALIGDKGIHEKVGRSFWNSIRDAMTPYFEEGRAADGLCEGIKACGEALKKHFPRQEDDRNELPNTLSKEEL